MTFAYPYLLYLLLIPAVLPVCAYLFKRMRSRKWEQLVAPKLRNELVIPSSHARQLIALIMGVLGLALVIFALARPQWGEREIEEVYKGRNILIAMDISRSMLTKDVQPSRLDQARTAAYDLLDALPEDKFGLLVFSGESSLILPLTHDHAAIKETLEQVNYGWIAYGGTDFNSVLHTALDTFKKTEGAKALVILSDGENTEEIAPALISDAAKQQLIVVAAGLGTTTGDQLLDPYSRDGIYKDRSGKTVISKFTPDALQNLADQTKGEFLHLVTPSQINRFIKRVADRLDSQEGASGVRKIPYERYAPFLGSGLMLLTLALLLSAGWTKGRAKSLLIFLSLFLGLALYSPVQAQEPATNGNSDEISESEVSLDDLLLESENKLAEHWGEDNVPREMEALRAFKNGYQQAKENKRDKAIEYFSRALLSENPRLQAESHYNIGNLLAENELDKLKKEGELEKILKNEKKLKAIKNALSESITHFDDALKTQEGHPNSLANKEALSRMMQKLTFTPPPPQDQQQNQDQQDKNQQNNDQQQNQNQQNQQQDKNQKDKQNQQQSQNQNNQQQQDKNQQDPKDENDKDKNNENKNDDKKQDSKDKESQQDDKGQQDKNDGDKGDEKEKKDNNPDDSEDSDTPDKEDPSEQDSNNTDKFGNSKNNKPNVGLAKEAEDNNEKRSPEEAAKILKERSDMEKGAPFPIHGINNSPKKDW